MPVHYVRVLFATFCRVCAAGRRARVFCAFFVLLPALFPAAPAAYAADAPPAEPEGAAYVRACAAEGEGYFYLPGTNTCFRLSGYVRSDVKAGNNHYARKQKDMRRSTYAWRSRAALRFNTATDTDLGALRSFVELRMQWEAGAEYGYPRESIHRLRFAYLELGGLRMGMDDSIFTHWTGYYGNVIMDDILNPMAESRTNAVSYNFTAANFKNGSTLSAILGLEQGDSEGDTSGFRYTAGGGKHFYKLSQQIGSYTPNIVGGLKWQGSAVTLAAVAAYDAYYSEWAAKMRLDMQVTDRVSLWAMAGYKSEDDYYAEDDSARRTRRAADGAPMVRQGIYRQVNSLYGDWGGHWIFWGGGSYTFSPQTNFNLQMSYSSDKRFATVANMQHSLVPGLALIPEISYAAWNNTYGYKYSNAYEEKAVFKGRSSVQGMMRLLRSF